MGGKTKEKIDNGQLLQTVTDKRQTRPLVREGAQQRQQRNSDRINIWSQVPRWARRQDILTDTVSRNVTSDLMMIHIVDEIKLLLLYNLLCI
jgi:hypothetical protein